MRGMWVLLTGVLLGLSLSVQAAEHPNVLLITVDDMSQDSVGVYGCKTPEITPHIDKLASEGLRFVHSHVTIAVCQPCRAVWLTGRYPIHNGALGFQTINKGVPTLTETLRDNGYLTGALAKISHVLPSRTTGWDVRVDAKDLHVGRSPELYYQHTLSFLKQAKTDNKPFFLMANAQDPHRPFVGSRRITGKNVKPKFKTAGNAPVTRIYEPQEVDFPGFLPDIPDVRKEIAMYFTSVHRADEVTGSVLQALEKSGLADNTIVIFLSDHGMPLPFSKTNCYFHSTRTPWIVRWPGKVKPGSVDSQHMVSGIDLTPTILEMVNVKPFAGIDGRSIVPLLNGEPQENRDMIYTQFHRTAGGRNYPMRSVVTKKYGYIYNGWANGEMIFKNESQAGLTMKAMIAAAKTNEQIADRVQLFLYRVPEEFYDYETDPDATRNLINDPDLQPVIRQYREKLLDHLRTEQDPLLKTYQQFLATPADS